MAETINSIDEFEWHAAGIPCIVAVIRYRPGLPEQREGMMAGPAEGPDADWVLLDRKGYRARWLEDKLDQDDQNDIMVEIIERMGDSW